MRRVHLLAAVGGGEEKDHSSGYHSRGLAQDLAGAHHDTSVNRTGGGPAVIIQSIDEKAGFDQSRTRNRSLADAKADGSMQNVSGPGQISHSGTLLSRTVTDKMSMLEHQDSFEVDGPAADIKPPKPRPAWKNKVEKLLENYYWVGMMSVVTLYALFADDFKILLLPKSADITMDVLTLIAMTLYLVELVLAVICIEGYLFSFYFWVDLLSLISMIPDVSIFMEGIEGGIGGADSGSDLVKTGRASKVIKIIRIIRLVRLLRVMKLYKQVKTGQKIKNQKI